MVSTSKALACAAAAAAVAVAAVGAARPGIEGIGKKIADEIEAGAKGQHWALLMAGSNSWGNYRHQADVYHAYQIMKKAGLSDDNIIVFHYDDIADYAENPLKGQVINKPNGDDVYAGVPKDYTGADVNAANFIAALKGDANAIKGGSGKVIASGPNDKVFVAFFDHGGPGILGVPMGTGPYIYAKDVNDALQAKHDASGYKELTFYIEACESGSIFDGLLPDDIDVYATTAANPTESSWGAYCPGMPESDPRFNTCLGDLYSISWMENVDSTDITTETLEQQYNLVQERTSQNGTYSQGSHVMQYGNLKIDSEMVSDFIGNGKTSAKNAGIKVSAQAAAGAVRQRDADLHSLYFQWQQAPEGSTLKAEKLAELSKETSMRAALDAAMAKATDVLLPSNELRAERPAGSAVVDDWDCYKAAVEAWGEGCGAPLGQYGMKHAGVLAKACNAGRTPADVRAAAQAAC